MNIYIYMGGGRVHASPHRSKTINPPHTVLTDNSAGIEEEPPKSRLERTGQKKKRTRDLLVPMKCLLG